MAFTVNLLLTNDNVCLLFLSFLWLFLLSFPHINLFKSNHMLAKKPERVQFFFSFMKITWNRHNSWKSMYFFTHEILERMEDSQTSIAWCWFAKWFLRNYLKQLLWDQDSIISECRIINILQSGIKRLVLRMSHERDFPVSRLKFLCHHQPIVINN